MSGLLVWRVPSMETPAPLVGAAIARVHTDDGDQVALACHADLLPVVSPSWVALSGGVSVAKVGQPDWRDYRRQMPWTVRLCVRDAFGAEWDCPALLSPEGIPVCDRSWVLLDDGTWGRRSVSEAQDRALAAAQAAFPIVHGDGDMQPDQLLPWACAIVESAYHLDAQTIGRLGLLTTASALAIVRAACGWLPDRGE